MLASRTNAFGLHTRGAMQAAGALVLSAISAAAVNAADAWPNPLIGEWRAMGESADKYKLPIDTIYSADGTFTASMSWGPIAKPAPEPARSSAAGLGG